MAPGARVGGAALRGGPWRPAPRPGASARLRIDRSTFGPTVGPKVERLGRILAAWRPEVGPRRSSTRSRPRPRSPYLAVREAPCRARPPVASRSGVAVGPGVGGRRGEEGVARRRRAPFGAIVRRSARLVESKVEAAGPNSRRLASRSRPTSEFHRTRRPRPPYRAVREAPASRRRGRGTPLARDADGARRPWHGTPRTGRRRTGPPSAPRPATPRVQHREHRAQERRRRPRSRPRRARAGRRRPAASIQATNTRRRDQPRRRPPARSWPRASAAWLSVPAHEVEAHAERDDREAARARSRSAGRTTTSITAGPISSRPSATAPAKRGDREHRDPDRAARRLVRPRSPRAPRGAAAARSGPPGRAAAARARSAAR